MRTLLFISAVFALSACATAQQTVDTSSYAAEAAFKTFDTGTNALITAGLPEPYLHILHVDYDAAHTALLAMRAGTGSATAVIAAISAASKAVPQLSTTTGS